MTSGLRRISADQPTNNQLLLWRGLLAIFLTGASLLTNYLNSGRVMESGVAVALLLLYGSLGAAWIAGRHAVPQRVKIVQCVLAPVRCVACGIGR